VAEQLEGVLRGFTVGITADRRSDEQAALFERLGASIFHGPAIRTLPLGAEGPLRAATETVIATPPDVLIANTGLGIRSWLGAADSWDLGGPLIEALHSARIYARGPKASGAAHQAGLAVVARAATERLRDVVDLVLPEMAPGRRVVHCPYCAFQCGIRLGGPGQTAVAGDADSPISRGQLCVKGWTAGELLGHPARLLHPRVRDRGGRLRQASWETALDELAGRLADIRDRHGPDAVGVFGSGALTNEKAYLPGKFARVALCTSNVDYNGRYCMSSAAAGQNRAFGPGPWPSVPGRGHRPRRYRLVVGSNCAETMPPILQWLDEQRAGAARSLS
jgi:Molybdopterin oxidoreductase/Uroporphyrinogen-III synthase HemD/Molybdopterin oxidoreductase Fe4S4 domain